MLACFFACRVVAERLRIFIATMTCSYVDLPRFFQCAIKPTFYLPTSLKSTGLSFMATCLIQVNGPARPGLPACTHTRGGTQYLQIRTLPRCNLKKNTRVLPFLPSLLTPAHLTPPLPSPPPPRHRQPPTRSTR